MELKDFIKNTITSISEGINEGHGYIVENNLGKGIPSGIKYVNIDTYVYTSSNKSDEKLYIQTNNDNTQSGNHIQFGIEILTNGVKVKNQ